MSINKCLFLATASSLFLTLLHTDASLAFSFTKIADNQDSFNSLGFFPAINNEGVVVFSTNLDADGEATGIFISNSRVTTKIADNSSAFSVFSPVAAINNAGTVAFSANLDDTSSGVFISNKGVITPIVNSSDPRGFGNPVINNLGQVVFSAPLNTQNQGIFTSNGRETSLIADTNDTYTTLDGYAINDRNTVAFVASLNTGGRGIFIYQGETTTPVVETNGDFDFLSSPTLNNENTIAFRGVLDNYTTEGIFTVKDGNLSTITDNSGPFSFFENPAINNEGIVAFKGALDTGGFGIYTGPDPVNDKVIAVGDALLGSTVVDLYFSNQGLNDANQVAFYAKLANGTAGIFRANPSQSPPPVPTPTLLPGLLILGVFGKIFRSKTKRMAHEQDLCSNTKNPGFGQEV
ncbi:hypothetical protein LC593_19990 [Nostoc sp. CHAB 5844]|nr:hypothetical protein [Nostoc sp. CHAB 5844]